MDGQWVGHTLSKGDKSITSYAMQWQTHYPIMTDEWVVRAIERRRKCASFLENRRRS